MKTQKNINNEVLKCLGCLLDGQIDQESESLTWQVMVWHVLVIHWFLVNPLKELRDRSCTDQAALAYHLFMFLSHQFTNPPKIRLWSQLGINWSQSALEK